MGTPTKIVLIISIVYFSCIVASHWSLFSLTASRNEYEHWYSQSQYVLGDRHIRGMQDYDIYTYAGIRYVEGEDVTKINFEHPPLVKYLFGLSYHLTGMPNWILLPLFILFVYSFWKISGYAISTLRGRYLSLALLLLHTSISKSLPETMLDLPAVAFLMLSTWLYLRFWHKPTVLRAVIFGISSALALTSKYPYPVTALYYVLLYLSAIIKQKISYRLLALSIIVTLMWYFLIYLSFFVHGGSLLDFIKFEWWRWQWYMGKTDNPKFILLINIFTGRDPTWWFGANTYRIISHWNFYWPLLFCMFIIASLRTLILKHFSHPLFSYQLWIVLALCVYMVGAGGDRFLIPLIPGFALFSAKFLSEIIRL